MAYDLSRFDRITFYLKGEKAASFSSKPNKIFTTVICFSETAKSKSGKMAQYYHRSGILPQKDWQKIEIPFEDFVPSMWTRKNVSNFPPKPDFSKVLQIFFMVSSFKSEGGITDSNTVWIDEITLQ